MDMDLRKVVLYDRPASRIDVVWVRNLNRDLALVEPNSFSEYSSENKENDN